MDVSEYDTNSAQLLIATCAAVIGFALADLAETRQPAVFAWWGIQGVAGTLGSIVFITAVASMVVGGLRQAGALVSCVLWAVSASLLVSAIWTVAGLPSGRLSNALFVWIALSIPLAFSVALFRGQLSIAVLRGSVFVAIVMLSFQTAMPMMQKPHLWQAVDERPYVEDEPTPTLMAEDLYHAQPELIDRQLSGLAPQRENVIDFYGLVVGGSSTDGAFFNEVKEIGDFLEANYGMSRRVLRLANSEQSPYSYPMASRPNLRTALNAIGDRMDPKDDVAVIYLTSHGAEDLFVLDFWQAQTASLTAQGFSGMLDDAGIERAVIILSSCYSGSFIDDLQSPERLIITAAAADRASFGCAGGEDWTRFGEAFVEEGLHANLDFRRAFLVANDAVKRWERDEEYESSHPQIAEGQEIAGLLDLYFSRLAMR